MVVERAGVDTWSPAWYIGRSGETRAARAMASLATVPAKRSRLIPEPIDGHRVGWFPSSGLLFAEGHPGGDALASGDSLTARFAQLRQALADHGIRVEACNSVHRWGAGEFGRSPGFAGIRRLDTTADLRFDSTAEGLAVLAGVAALGLPRTQLGTRHQPGGRALETVYFYGHGGKRVLARWYDKGIEGGLAPRGRLIRPEDQWRFTQAARLPVEAFTTHAVRTRFQRRFLPLWKASKGVTVATPDDLARHLQAAVRDERITGPMAYKLLGYLHGEHVGLEVADERTRRRYRAECRDLGLVLAGGALDPVEVDLHAVLEAALESEAWGRDG